MNPFQFLRADATRFIQIAATSCACLCCVSTDVSAQTPLLEFHYEFDTDRAPLVDTSGQNANIVLQSNGVAHRLGEASLIGDNGFSVGLDTAR